MAGFLVTKQHRRFVEFADAVRRHRVLRSARPGQDALSARTYAAADDWDHWIHNRVAVFVSVRIAATIRSQRGEPGQLAPRPRRLLQGHVDQIGRIVLHRRDHPGGSPRRRSARVVTTTKDNPADLINVALEEPARALPESYFT